MHATSPVLDRMRIAVPRSAGIDLHKMQPTVSLRLCKAGPSGQPSHKQTIGTDPPTVVQRIGCLKEHTVRATTMTDTVVFGEWPYRDPELGGFRLSLVHARHGKQIKAYKTDVSDSLWLARILPFGLPRKTSVPPEQFSHLWQLSRYRRKLVADRANIRQRIHIVPAREGLHLTGELGDIFWSNGHKPPYDLLEQPRPHPVSSGLSQHVGMQRLDIGLHPAGRTGWPLALAPAHRSQGLRSSQRVRQRPRLADRSRHHCAAPAAGPPRDTARHLPHHRRPARPLLYICGILVTRNGECRARETVPSRPSMRDR